ncbi:hypothetical protein J3F84DRAFT_110729 [Trichoderma pleuroticola]
MPTTVLTSSNCLVPRISTNRAADYIRPSSPACRLTDHLTQQHPRPRRRCVVSFPPHPSLAPSFALLLTHSSLFSIFSIFACLLLVFVTTLPRPHTPSHSFFNPFSSFGPVAFFSPVWAAQR